MHGAELADLVGLGDGKRVLDLGCGPGESAFGMLDRAPSARAVGLDFSASMIRFANLRRRFEPRADRVELVQGDARALPFPDESFDAVTGHSFLYLVPDLDRVLAEAARVMKKGARCAFLEPTSFPGERRAGFVDVPRDVAARVWEEPRFVTSMALWRIASRGYGRFDEGRFRASFERAGLDLVECRSTLGGMGLFGVGRKR
jgi:ubiquinone/menaquinone biosynthesis C-methylase UbiE